MAKSTPISCAASGLCSAVRWERCNWITWLPKSTAAYLLAALAVSVAGCESYEAVQAARLRGVQAGTDEGRRAGEADGYAKAWKRARDQAYNAKLAQLYEAGEFRRLPGYTHRALVLSFAAGFILQWLILGVARVAGILHDIDWIVLPHLAQIKPGKLAESQLGATQQKISGSASALMLLLALSSTTGCRNAEEAAWREGYDANWKSAYREGETDGAARGKVEGEKAGLADAATAVGSGTAWELYTRHATGGFLAGMVVGIYLQYNLLLYGRWKGHLPELLTVAFIPGVKKSLCYRVFAKRRELLIWWREERSKIAAEKKLSLAQMQGIQDLALEKIQSISSLEQFSQAQLVEIARAELSNIISNAERRANAGGQSQRKKENALLRTSCPHCNRFVGYKHGGRTVECPHQGCGRPIQLP